MPTALVIHGHFYQPPRENPWTDVVDREPSAQPFHDWNERIHHECYRANAYARIVDGQGRVDRIVNNYGNMSFNFGPTLLSWLKKAHPDTYLRILEADRESVRKRRGHGNAIAQGYNHTILPLCNDRDRVTQVRWGLADFRHHFGREPESLWLPETACNDATLETLIDEGMKYVILSPQQAERVRPIGKEQWRNVADGSIDPSVPYAWLHRDGSGRSIAIFFYDGPISRAIAFEGALASSQGLLERFTRIAHGEGHIAHVATDGESYGHHFHFGDRCIAYALEVEARSRGFWVTNYGEFLERFPPAHEVEIKKGEGGFGTAWSCSHGVGRWYRDCGCNSGGRKEWNQAWRAPLRAALDHLRDEAARAFEQDCGQLLEDPWAARDAYIELVLDRDRPRDEFLRKHAGRQLHERERARALLHLELQRNAMLMYTSCGWFFDDISGLEAVQVLKYAGRVLDLIDELDLESPRDRFLEILSEAESNIPEMGTGADCYQSFVEATRVTPDRVAAHLGIFGLVADGEDAGEIAGYYYRKLESRKEHHGRHTLATSRTVLESVWTGKSYEFAVAAMRFGGVDFYCVLKPFPGTQRFRRSTERLWADFTTASLPTLLRIAQEEFGGEEFGLEHVLPEGRDRISTIVFGDLVQRLSDEYARFYEENRRTIEMLQDAGFELPAELRAAAEFTLGKRFEEEIVGQDRSFDPKVYQKAVEIAAEVTRHGYRIDRTATGRMFEEMISEAVRSAVGDPSPENLEATLGLLTLAKKLGIEAKLDRAQDLVYQALLENPRLAERVKPIVAPLGLSARLSAAPEPARPKPRLLRPEAAPRPEAGDADGAGPPAEAPPVAEDERVA